MTRSWLRVCAASSFVGAGLVLGCHHGPRQGDCASGGITQSTAMKAVSESQPTSTTGYLPIPHEPVVVVNEPPPAAEQSTTVPQAPEPVAEAAVEQANFVNPIAEEDHGKIHRRSFADITADPCFAHAPDYTSLTGELYYLKPRQCWTLRFASVDEEDRYGGSVTLTDLGTMDEFQSGQMVRVEGHLADPESREPCPKFQVRSIHLVK